MRLDQTPIRVLVWCDDARGRDLTPPAAAIHPDGIAVTVAGAIREQLGDTASVATADIADPGQGLDEDRLVGCDVLVWWGHERHDEVADVAAERVQRHVIAGMGMVVLHSGHHSKPFRWLMGTTCDLSYREGDDRELIWCLDPAHPIAAGVEQPIALARHEMYGEPFDIPTPDQLVFVSAFSGGEVFRSGCCFTRGRGRVFYFSPGHETDPVYEHPQIRRVIGNAVRWACPTARVPLADLRAREVQPAWGTR